MERIKVLAIAGPTASGKTALSVALAKRLGGEIVSCDVVINYMNNYREYLYDDFGNPIWYEVEYYEPYYYYDSENDVWYGEWVTYQEHAYEEHSEFTNALTLHYSDNLLVAELEDGDSFTIQFTDIANGVKAVLKVYDNGALDDFGGEFTIVYTDTYVSVDATIGDDVDVLDFTFEASEDSINYVVKFNSFVMYSVEYEFENGELVFAEVIVGNTFRDEQYIWDADEQTTKWVQGETEYYEMYHYTFTKTGSKMDFSLVVNGSGCMSGSTEWPDEFPDYDIVLDTYDYYVYNEFNFSASFDGDDTLTVVTDNVTLTFTVLDNGISFTSEAASGVDVEITVTQDGDTLTGTIYAADEEEGEVYMDGSVAVTATANALTLAVDFDVFNRSEYHYDEYYDGAEYSAIYYSVIDIVLTLSRS